MKRARVTMTSEDIRNRKWTEAEVQAMRRAGAARAAGLDLPEKEYEDISRLTPQQLASMVRLRGPRRKQAVSGTGQSHEDVGPWKATGFERARLQPYRRTLPKNDWPLGPEGWG